MGFLCDAKVHLNRAKVKLFFDVCHIFIAPPTKLRVGNIFGRVSLFRGLWRVSHTGPPSLQNPAPLPTAQIYSNLFNLGLTVQSLNMFKLHYETRVSVRKQAVGIRPKFLLVFDVFHFCSV